MTERAFAADDMDAILDDALDELDDSDSDSDIDSSGLVERQQTNNATESPNRGPLESTPSSTEGELRATKREDPKRRVPFGPPRPPSTTHKTEQDTDESLRKMFRDLAAGTDLPTIDNNANVTKKTEKSSSSTSGTEQGVSPPDEEALLNDLFKGLMAADGETNESMPDMDNIPDLANIFAELGESGGNNGGDKTNDVNADDFLDGMMEQLLSKDLMYEPMKQVAEEFPAWLDSQKGKLDSDEWDHKNRQFECFQKLVAAYESQGESPSAQQTAKVLELMQEVQKYGQPPLEIINKIAPGLELDGEGLPKNMNGMPPFLGGNGNPEDCRIM